MTPVSLPSALAFSLAAVAAFTVILISLRCLPWRWLLIVFSCSLSLLESEACSGIVRSFQCQGPCPHAYALILDSSVGQEILESFFSHSSQISFIPIDMSSEVFHCLLLFSPVLCCLIRAIAVRAESPASRCMLHPPRTRVLL